MNKLTLFILLLAAVSCNKPAKETQEEAEQTPVSDVQKPALDMVWQTDTVLTTNESVLFDAERNVLYVSNIEGKPTEKDGKGSISRLTPEGSISELEWVTGLDAPKGMAVLGEKLYVTNIDELVEINISDGTVAARYPVEGAQFLNDVATDGQNVYFSDMNTGKIHLLESGEVSVFMEGVESINGLAFNSHGELFGLDAGGLKKFSMEDMEPEVINDVVTGGDGLVVLDDSTFIASRWKGEIYLIRNGKEHLLLDTKDQNSNTADIGYIPAKQHVLVPTFFANKVAAYKLTY